MARTIQQLEKAIESREDKILRHRKGIEETKTELKTLKSDLVSAKEAERLLIKKKNQKEFKKEQMEAEKRAKATTEKQPLKKRKKVVKKAVKKKTVKK